MYMYVYAQHTASFLPYTMLLTHSQDHYYIHTPKTS